VQRKRTPEEWKAAQQRIEQARTVEMSYRKCRAVKSHTIRTRSLACEGLRQMSMSSDPCEHLAAQGRWKSAQEASKSLQEKHMLRCDAAMAKQELAAVLSDADEEEQEAMEEVAGLVGAEDAQAMASAGAEGLEATAFASRGGSSRSAGVVASGGSFFSGPLSTATSVLRRWVGRPDESAARRPLGQPVEAVNVGGGAVQALLAQLRLEPANEEECAAKFSLYEGYASEVEQMRKTITKFHEDSRPNVPATVANDMDKQVRGIDCEEAMGIPDGAREWFVFHMMRQSERNNLNMARILEGFEKKLEFLAANDQAECPICLEAFATEGLHVAETLGCCHKVCRDCWNSWHSVTHGRPFCPLCRHDAFLGIVAAAARSPAGMAPPDIGVADSDSD